MKLQSVKRREAAEVHASQLSYWLELRDQRIGIVTLLTCLPDANAFALHFVNVWERLTWSDTAEACNDLKLQVSGLKLSHDEVYKTRSM
jgi:hypothetical protein